MAIPVGPGGPVHIGPISVLQPVKTALTAGQTEVLRKVVSDANFRKNFATNPVSAVSGAGIHVSAGELGRLERLNPAQMEQFARGVSKLATASGDGGTHTLLYAIVVALLLE